MQAIADNDEGVCRRPKRPHAARRDTPLLQRSLATTAGKIGLNVDTRGVGSGNGGDVLLPPSCTDKGAYTWEDQRPMATLDQWVADICARAAADTGPADQTPLVERDQPAHRERPGKIL